MSDRERDLEQELEGMRIAVAQGLGLVVTHIYLQ